MEIQRPTIGSGLRQANAAAPSVPAAAKQQQELPKCFGTDYFGKWNMTGMTFDSMKIDNTEFQRKCAFCPFFDRCYLCNHIRLLRIKR